MKIGILTYHRAINYGSVLQAWATKDLLEKEGFKVEVIDYEPENSKKNSNIYLSGYKLSTCLKNILRIPVAKYKKKKIKAFDKFRKNYLNLSDFSIDNNDDSDVLSKRYDCIICGSDQIWNVHASDCDDIFFLPEVTTKKIAFSVSVNNTDYTETRCNEAMKKWISDFDFISCREESGKRKIKDFLGGNREVYTFLDPTLMHKKEDYYPLCSERIIDTPYIFLYKVWSGKESYSLVSELGKRLQIPVYTIFMHSNILALCKVESTGINVIKNMAGPGDYLSLIRYSNYVVTDSFHGTAFSIIFEKKFICVKETKSDGGEKNDERIISILKTLNFENRYISLKEISEFPIMDSIDYSSVTKKRMKIASNNICLLKDAISE